MRVWCDRHTDEVVGWTGEIRTSPMLDPSGPCPVIRGVLYMHPSTFAALRYEINFPGPTADERARWADDGGA